MLKSSILQDITTCSPSEVNRHLEEHVASIFRVEKLSELTTYFMLGLFFQPEDGSDMFPETSVDLQHNIRPYILEDRTPYDHHRQNLNSTDSYIQYTAIYCRYRR
jgi:hypothetical protein